ncbi:unnamed protein product [Amoebophrya sp. A120]|nr:unnamed protein product [Amoebophrya sp. A120]|eukprot:GSA120T00006296001.1
MVASAVVPRSGSLCTTFRRFWSSASASPVQSNPRAAFVPATSRTHVAVGSAAGGKILGGHWNNPNHNGNALRLRNNPRANRSSCRSPLLRPGAQQQIRHYRHWHAPAVDDFTLPPHSMPIDIKEILKDPSKREFDFLDHYWYWRIRKESTIMHPERLVTLTYKQLAYDMGMPVVSDVLEHHMGIIELYEYLKSSPMIGPFGTVENPVIVPSLSDIRQVCCTGGTGDNEHDAMFFHCREGFLYRCGECDQIFMLVRVTYGNSWVDESYKDHKEIFAKDPDVDDVFDIKLLERGHRMWNSSDMLRWEMGAQALNAVPTPEDATEMKMPVIREVDLSVDADMKKLPAK